MTVFVNRKNEEEQTVEIKVAENYYVNFNEVVSATIRDDCITELEDYIKSKENCLKKVAKMSDKKVTLLSNEDLKKHLNKVTENTKKFDKKVEIINEELKKFAGYGILCNSYDYFNVRNSIGISVAKENLETLKSLKFDRQKMSLSVEDMLKDLKINSEE